MYYKNIGGVLLGDYRARLFYIILSIPAILVAFTFHEYAHAAVADKLGDKTPRFQGRLTLNPLAHIDPIGFILILLVNFGWAKPVEINANAFKHYNKDDLKVSIAGPVANLAVAFISSFAYVLLFKYLPNTELSTIIVLIFRLIASINSMFFILNLLPLPGFDGFHVLRDLFPKTFYNLPEAIYTYQLLIFILLAMPIVGGNSILGYVIGIPSQVISSAFISLASTVFGL